MPICEWPNGCTNAARRLIEGSDPSRPDLNFRWWLCEEVHLPAMLDGTARDVAERELAGLGIRLDVEAPEIQAAKAALDAHQRSCETCRAVHDWTANEFLVGAIRTLADRDRVGRYTIEHSCPDGLALFSEMGRVMAAPGAIGAPDSRHRRPPEP